MKLVSQTKFSLFYSDGKRLTYGNCLIACIASILEQPIDEVPNVYTFYGLDEPNTNIDNHLWFNVMNSWMTKKFNKKITVHTLNESPTEDFVIVRGLSTRRKPHCCIYENKNGELIPFFDPHPTEQFLIENHYYYTIKTI